MPLERALGNTGLEWTLCFIGEGQFEKLHELNNQLKRPYNPDGQGKFISSGFAYWGTGPSYEWTRACRDKVYRVMRDGIENFAKRWQALEGEVQAKHYVSLGTGTGEKDATIVSSMLRGNPDLYYIPVDMSSDLLRVGVLEVLQRVDAMGPSHELCRTHVLPVQLDFGISRNLGHLRHLLDEVIGDEPVLFGLLGNTVANFRDESEVLRGLANLIRPGKDFLLLETAWTQDTSQLAIELAQAEYGLSTLFRQFAVSALIQNTDLPVDISQVEVHCAPCEGALKIDVWYRAPEPRQMVLLGGDSVDIKRGETIRLYISRKYTDAALESTLLNNGLRKLPATAPHWVTFEDCFSVRFGVTLSLCQYDEQLLRYMPPPRHLPQTLPPPRPSGSPEASKPLVFVSYAHEDLRWLVEVREHLATSLHRGELELWSDREIEIGNRWDASIAEMLLRCKVAVLLVSQKFVNSDYIMQRELPVLLEAASTRHVRIIWIPISASAWLDTPLARLQAACPPDVQLDTLPPPQQARMLVTIAAEIRRAALEA